MEFLEKLFETYYKEKKHQDMITTYEKMIELFDLIIEIKNYDLLIDRVRAMRNITEKELNELKGE